VQQPAQTPVFRSRIDIVRTDVVVVDRSTGKALTGLTAGDFTVTENGVRQDISSFLAEAGAAEAVAPAPTRRRVFLLVFGWGHLDGPVAPYDGAIRFLRERLRQDDIVAVLAWNRLTSFTADRDPVVQVLERLKRVPPELWSAFLQDLRKRIDLSPDTQGMIDAWLRPPNAPSDFLRSATALLLGTSEYERNDEIWRQWNGKIVSNDVLKVAAGIEYLRRLDGEKHLVLLSRWGLRPPFKLLSDGVGWRLDGREDDRRLAARANDAGVALGVLTRKIVTD